MVLQKFNKIFLFKQKEPNILMNIKWSNIKFQVTDKDKNNKTMLDNLSGQVHDSNIVAIMGPSGAGKSSLLNILSGFNTNFTGKLEYNNNSNIKKFKNSWLCSSTRCI